VDIERRGGGWASSRSPSTRASSRGLTRCLDYATTCEAEDMQLRLDGGTGDGISLGRCSLVAPVGRVAVGATSVGGGSMMAHRHGERCQMAGRQQ
jgi:hypothetical protein